MKIVLQPYETIEQRKAKQQLAVDADLVHRVVRNNPGVPSRAAISAQTGLSARRVREVMRRINAGETGHIRIEYGKVRARGGLYAGEVVMGWYAMNVRRHHVAMDQADEHSALVEVGVRRSRLIRFAQSHGIRGAEEVVARIEERLGLSVEAMTERDLESFEQLVMEYVDA